MGVVVGDVEFCSKCGILFFCGCVDCFCVV